MSESEQVHFDALELARLANPEIDDMRRIALAPSYERHSVETANVVTTAVLRAFRALSKGA